MVEKLDDSKKSAADKLKESDLTSASKTEEKKLDPEETKKLMA